MNTPAACNASDQLGQPRPVLRHLLTNLRPPLWRQLTLRLGLLAIWSLALSGCGARVQQPLVQLRLAPEVLRGGEQIYLGRVFGLGRKGDVVHAELAPTFIYERRVGAVLLRGAAAGAAGSALRATHITRDGAGRVVVADSALHTAGYDLIDYQLYGDQLGQSGSVQVRGERVTFLLHGAEGDKTAEEKQSSAVLVGPTLVGFIVRRRARLAAGEAIPVRLAVLERLETLGFELRAVAAAPGQWRVEMAASSPLIGLAVAPIYFTFDVLSGKLLRMEGRVPPKVVQDNRWHDFDARVEYTYVAAAYR